MAGLETMSSSTVRMTSTTDEGGVTNCRTGFIQPAVALSRPELATMWFFKLCMPLVLAGLFGCQQVNRPDPVERPKVHTKDDAQKKRLESGKTIWVCRVQKPGEGPQDLVTLLPPDEMFTNGLIPEAIVGVLKAPLKEGEAIKAENFVRNKVFNEFMHEVIARVGPELKGLQAEARRQGEGWVYLIDGRTKTPEGQVPPQDIIGGFEAKVGQLVARSYKRNPKHVLLSQDGFFRLPVELNEVLKKELTARNNKAKKSDEAVQGNNGKG